MDRSGALTLFILSRTRTGEIRLMSPSMYEMGGAARVYTGGCLITTQKREDNREVILDRKPQERYRDKVNAGEGL